MEHKKQMRYFLEISYNGRNYHGWQIQKNAHSVQEELNKALKQLFSISFTTIGSGRTDTGVHACQQFVHFDAPFEITSEHIYKLNRILPFDIVIHSIFKVPPSAHARFDAISRKYEYRMVKDKNPFLLGLSYYFPRDLDIDLMNQCCTLLKLHQDFECFSKIKTEVDHFLCNIYEAEWIHHGQMLIFSVKANRFLRGMVRAMVGTMLEAGLGRLTTRQFQNILISKNRKAAGRSVPPEGLFLTEIKYPENLLSFSGD